jgi:hypothetical protein
MPQDLSEIKGLERLKLICHENETRYVFSPINKSIENSLIQIADK